MVKHTRRHLKYYTGRDAMNALREIVASELLPKKCLRRVHTHFGLKRFIDVMTDKYCGVSISDCLSFQLSFRAMGAFKAYSLCHI